MVLGSAVLGASWCRDGADVDPESLADNGSTPRLSEAVGREPELKTPTLEPL